MLRLKKGVETQVLAVAGGFLEVCSGSRVAVFTETAEMAGEIDEERARLAAERAKEEMRKVKDPEGLGMEKFEADLKRALLRLKVADARRFKGPRPGGPSSSGH